MVRTSRASLVVALVLAAAAITVARAAPPAATTGSTFNFPSVAGPYLNALATNRSFQGTVLFARNGQVVFEHGYGMADAAHNIRNGANTRFRMASITKEFTATGILLLQDHGKLSVNDRACTYIPGCPAGSWWEQITLKMLLTHTAGLSHQCGIPGYQHFTPYLRMIQNCEKAKFLSQPGTHYSYSNAGYMILGYIIEKLSGVSYPQFIRENILQPLGMNSSGIAAPGVPPPPLSVPYQPSGTPARPFDLASTVSFGGLYSTVGDMVKWDRALDQHRLLSPTSYREMFTPYPTAGQKSCHYGFGWIVQDLGGHLMVWHNGALTGVSTFNARMPEYGIDIVMLENLGKANPAQDGRKLAYWWVQESTLYAPNTCDQLSPT